MAVKFTGRAKPIEDVDLPRIASRIGVGEDEMHAVIDVEAAGSGFDSRGRLKMLYEPHVFYRNLSGAKRDRAVREGLAYPRWRSGAYPQDSYPRLEQAMEIDETAALKACSWGLGQILGENHKAAGYDSPQAMIADFVEDEDNHLEAMVRFIQANKLDDEIRRHDWAGFARGYNGSQYATHGYHTRLAKAYAKWAKIRDTAWDGTEEVEVTDGGEIVKVPHGEQNDEIRDVQKLLVDFNYHEVGEVDGKWGGRTRGAITAYRNDRHLTGPAIIDDALIEDMGAALREGWTRPIAKARSAATVEKVAEKVETVEHTWWSRLLAKVGFGATVGGGSAVGIADFASDHFETATDWWNKIHGLLDTIGVTDVPVWLWLVVFGLLFGLIWKSQRKAEQSVVDAYREGKIN